MEQNSSTIWKSSLIYGLYLALISILISVIIWAGDLMQSFGIWGSAIIGLISIVITFVLLIVFTKLYRNKVLGGFISYGHAFKFGVLVVVFATIISSLYNLLFHTVIDPGYTENLMAVMQQKTISYMEQVGAPESQIDKTVEKFSDIPTVWETIKQGLLIGVISGVILSLISAAIVKKKEEPIIEE